MKFATSLTWLIALAAGRLAGEEAKPPPSLTGIWLMGQSLCDGSESLPIVTKGDTGWGNFAFLRGVRTWLPNDHSSTPEARSAEQFQWVPLHATTNGGLGETVANGLADHLKDLLKRMSSAGQSSHYLVACAGQGGRQIQELSSKDLSQDPRTPASRQHGGGYYRTSLDDARRAKDQATARGMKFEIAALYWMQGEGNGGPTSGIVPTRWDPELPRPIGLEWYRDELIAYHQKWSADLTAITGQTAELPMFTYQTLGPAGEAQLMAADADPALYMVGPHYAVPSALNSRTPQGRHGDAIHLSADGERWWGEQVGKVIHRVLHRDEKWQPLRPLQARLEDSRDALVIDFHVPRPPLVLDTEFLPRQEITTDGGFSSLAGFQVRDASGVLVTLTRIEVVNATRVRIVFSHRLPISQACSVSYGHPFAATLGKIAKIRPGPPIDGQPAIELHLESSFAKQLKPLIDEGAFFLTSISGKTARAPIRQVLE
ncbi:MAG: hypothetical protein KDK97_17270, partial [Verrucomicrobiales bacterium]|nr:hypothetical protein [Verrucomicrobiales bacterium]